MAKGRKCKSISTKKTTNSSTTSKDTNTNKPRNLLVQDATRPYTFSYQQFGMTKRVTVNQSVEELTWPGGALWDCGVLLAKVLVDFTTTTTNKYTNKIFKCSRASLSMKNKIVLELGCGVGLTGLVACSLGAKHVFLTDLEVVVEHIAQVNAEQYLKGIKQKGHNINVTAFPLCWGNDEDIQQIKTLLSTTRGSTKNKQSAAFDTRRTTKNKNNSSSSSTDKSTSCYYYPDVILIGDVAYQHKPGAPCFFDELVSTVLELSDKETIVMFSTRMRMPASNDLLNMFHEHFEEMIDSPIAADEIDLFFEGMKHNISIHILRRKTKKI